MPIDQRSGLRDAVVTAAVGLFAMVALVLRGAAARLRKETQ